MHPVLLVDFRSGRDCRVVIYLDCFFSLSLSPSLHHLAPFSSSSPSSSSHPPRSPPGTTTTHKDMVKLSLVSPKGNQGVRYFPYQGYLGLTPLRFEGRAYSSLSFSHPTRSYPSSQSSVPRSSKTANSSLPKTSLSHCAAMSRAKVAWVRSKQTSSTSTRSPFGRSQTLRSGPKSGIPNTRFGSPSLLRSLHLAPHSTSKSIGYSGGSRQASTSRHTISILALTSLQSLIICPSQLSAPVKLSTSKYPLYAMMCQSVTLPQHP